MNYEGRRPGLESLLAAASTPDGKKVTLTRNDWLHARFRHPGVGNNPAALLQAVSHPDEIHQDRRGGHHALKRIDQRHFLVVIYEFAEGRGGLIRTGFMSTERGRRGGIERHDKQNKPRPGP